MIFKKNDFYHFIKDKFEVVGTITKYEEQAFFDVFHSKNAEKSKVIYIWIWNKDINRLQGNSKILYIGKTDKTIAQRYSKTMLRKYDLKTPNNQEKYKHIFCKSGTLTILQLSLHDVEKIFIPEDENLKDPLRYLEGFLLRMYFKNHLEFPPFNYTKTTVKNDELEIVFKI